jgi:hypothetical protein
MKQWAAIIVGAVAGQPPSLEKVARIASTDTAGIDTSLVDEPDERTFVKQSILAQRLEVLRPLYNVLAKVRHNLKSFTI